MAELALAASIIQVAGKAADIVIGLYKVANAIGYAGYEVRLIANEISSTSQVLTHLGNILNSQNRRQPEARRIAEQHLAICDRLFEESTKLLLVLKPLVERSGQSKTRHLGLRLKWLLSRSKFSLHRQSLESLKLSLNLLLTSMNYVEASRNQVSEDIFDSFRKQLQIAISAAETTPVSTPRKNSLQSSISQTSGGTSLSLTAFSDGESDSSVGVATPEFDMIKEGEDETDCLERDSFIEMIEFSKKAAVERKTAPNSITAVDFSNEFELGDNTQAMVLYVQLMSLAHDTAVQARKTLEGGPNFRSNDGPRAPRFAWICSTHANYIAACLALDEEFDADPETSWLHDASLTFGRIHVNHIVIIYHSVDDYEDDHATYVLQDTLRRRFDSIELCLITGTGGVPFEISQRFDIRLGDVVVGENTSMCMILPSQGSNKPILDVRSSCTPISWWVRQIILKHKSRRLRLRGYEATNLFNRTRDSRQNREYQRPGGDSDLLFPREIAHNGCPTSALDCSRCEGAVPRPTREKTSTLPQYGEDDCSYTHYGNAFVYTGGKDSTETKAFDNISMNMHTPSVFTKNGYCLVNKFPCLVITGISNYLDSHAQSRWEGHAEMMAVAYATELIATR